MTDTWTRVPLSDLAEVSTGKGLRREERLEDGPVPIFGANGVIGYTVEPLLVEPAVIVGRVGAYGAVNLAPEGSWVSDNALICSPRPNVPYKFLQALLETVDYDVLVHGTTQPLITQSGLRSYEVMFPPIEDQRRIAEVLGALDDRIDSLQRLQSLLQDEARSLLALAFLNGSVDVALDSIAEVVMGNSPPGSTYNTDVVGAPLFQGCAEFGFRYPSERLYTTQPSRMAAENDTLVSVRAPVGKLNRASGVCCIGRGLAAVRSEMYPSLVYYALDASEDVWGPYNSEGTVFGSINGGSLRGLNLTWPADADVLEQQLRGIDEAIKRFAVEETELASARALLLPALVSGELRVTAAEELVEAAT